MTNAKNAKAEDMLKQGVEQLTKNVDTMSSFAKENVDAALQVANLATKGAEKIASEALAMSKQNIEQSVTVAKEFATNVRTFDQFVAIQTQYSKQAFEQYVQQATKLGDLFISLSKEISAPINGRVNALSEQFSKKAS